MEFLNYVISKFYNTPEFQLLSSFLRPKRPKGLPVAVVTFFARHM